MSFAYYRWFPGDYARDTGHLTLLQHGAYRHLLDAYMATGKPIRGDLNALCRICGALSGEERQAVEFVLAEFFTPDGPNWRNNRCDRELGYLTTLSESGRKAAAMRWHSDGNANQNQNQNQNQNPKVKPIVGLAPDPSPKELTGKALRDAAKRVLECLNQNAGRRYEPVDANINPILARMREGYTEQDLRAIAAVKGRQWRGDEKMAVYIRPKTLYGATNAAQYRAELPANQLEGETP